MIVRRLALVGVMAVTGVSPLALTGCDVPADVVCEASKPHSGDRVRWASWVNGPAYYYDCFASDPNQCQWHHWHWYERDNRATHGYWVPQPPQDPPGIGC
jgi:hypothetical protein